MSQETPETKPKRTALLPMAQQRSEFLRNCRARIQPGDIGLPEPQRRRTRGLRREDVAALSGVSLAWYTWLEQGREIRVSDDVLERICNTFRLSEDERTYLFTLVQNRPPRPTTEDTPEIEPALVRLMDNLEVPAVLCNLRWDVLHWNRLQGALYRDYSQLALSRRNLIEVLFDQTVDTTVSAEFEQTARRVLAKLRVDYSRSGNDPKFESLIRRMEADSPLFRRIWRTPEINVRSYGLHRFTHAVYGPLAFEHTSYFPEGHPMQRLVMCLPQDDATRAALASERAKLR